MDKLKSLGKQKVDILLFILIIIQPILDVISFFMIENGMTLITTALRMVIFVVVTLYAFIMSDNKKPYFIMAAVLVVYWIFHMIGCFSEGYQSLFQDIALFIRTIQMPVFTLCFIDIFKKGTKIPKIIQKAFVCNYLIITGVIILSYIVNKPVTTYLNVGIKGWFATGNAQSCIISLMAPLSVYFAFKLKSNWKFALIVLISFLNMFCFGTRVAYYYIFLTIASAVFFMVLSKKRNYFAYGFLCVCFIASLLCYKISPCYKNQFASSGSVQEWQTQIENLKEKSEKEEQGKEEDEDDKKHSVSKEKMYLEVYNLYSKPLVEKFGLKRVLEKYDYSLDAGELVNNRNLKINYSSLVMDEKNLMVHLFGFEYMDFIDGKEIYDPENDFPAIYFSNGIVGLIMYIGFLAYFVYLILKKLITDFKNSLTFENGMVATTLIMILFAAQLSGNVLRRPNVSIYLSLILAYIFYLCVLKKDKENG